MVDASERLRVLLNQEETIYRTSDYLVRMQRETTSVDADAFVKVDNSSGSSSPESSRKKRKSLSSFGVTATGSTSPNGACEPGQSGDSSTNSQINKHWREKICEWAYQVVDHFDLNREVVSIAMSHLDRYLAVYPSTVDKNLFQLLAMTCLYLSIKLNEYKHLLIPGSRSSMDTILQLSRGFFTLEQMEQMEYDVLQRLQWHVHPPTPQLFVKHFLFFLSIDEHEVHDLSQFMVELSVMDYFFVNYKASEIAVAGVLHAVERLLPGRAIQDFQKAFINVNTPEVLACRERLSLIFAQANDQLGNDTTDYSPKTNRTTSPVSVMAAPQPDNMDAEYSDTDDDL